MPSKFEKVRRILFTDVLSSESSEQLKRFVNVVARIVSVAVSILTTVTFFGFLYLLAERYVWKEEVWALATMAGHRWVKDAQHHGEPFKMEKLEDLLHAFDESPIVEQWFLYPMRYSVECTIEGAKSQQKFDNK